MVCKLADWLTIDLVTLILYTSCLQTVAWGRMWLFACFYLAPWALFLPLTQSTIPPTDRNNGELILPLTPMMGDYSL